MAVIGPGATHQLNSLVNLYQSETGDTTKVLKIYPECFQNINDSTHVENQVVEFDEGCFVVVQSKENPADFSAGFS